MDLFRMMPVSWSEKYTKGALKGISLAPTPRNYMTWTYLVIVARSRRWRTRPEIGANCMMVDLLDA